MLFRSFGLLPASAVYVRHAQRIAFRDVDFAFVTDDTRPPVVLDDVAGIEFEHLKAPRAGGASLFVLRGVKDFSARDCSGLANTTFATVDNKSL